MDFSFGAMLTDLARTSQVAARLLPLLACGELNRQQNQLRLGVPVPRVCMLSVTWRCNLHCVGCYAANYRCGTALSLDEIERVVREATDAGTFLFIVVGGEPLLVDGLVECLARNRKALFFLFTNGTVLTAGAADRIAAAGNVFPMLSVDGDEALTDARRGPGVFRRVEAAMELLRAREALFGFCSVITHANVHTITARSWFDRMWANGARFGALIDYIPFPHGLDPRLVLTGEDLALRERAVAERYREAHPIVVNFPGHEYASGGCGAAGKVFLHINADGFVEPCPFSHVAADNVRDKSFVEILRSPFLSELRACTETWLCEDRTRDHCLLFSRREDVNQLARRHGAFCTESPVETVS